MDQRGKRPRAERFKESDEAVALEKIKQKNIDIMTMMLVEHFKGDFDNLKFCALASKKISQKEKYFHDSGNFKKGLVKRNFISAIFEGHNLDKKDNKTAFDLILKEIKYSEGVFNVLNSCKCSADDMKKIFHGRYPDFVGFSIALKRTILSNRESINCLQAGSDDFADYFWGKVADEISTIQDVDRVQSVFKAHFEGLVQSKAVSSADGAGAASASLSASTDRYLEVSQQQSCDQYQRRQRQPAPPPQGRAFVASLTSGPAGPKSVVAKAGASAARSNDSSQQDGPTKPGFGKMG